MIIRACLIFIFLSAKVWAQNQPRIETVLKTLPGGKKVIEETRIYPGPKFNHEEYEKLKMKIGWVYPINSYVEHIKQEQGGTDKYDVLYNINEYGQRLLSIPKKPRKKHLILGGDSNIFGIGNKDEDTVAYLMGVAHPDYEPYNFGHGGGAPHNTLALLENYSWEKMIKQTDGIMIYVFYPEWMTIRTMGTKEYLRWDMGGSPWYELNFQENLVLKGNFQQRFLTNILTFIDSIDPYQWIGDLPKVTSSDMKLISKIFLKMKLEYLKKFSNGRFVVAVSNYSLIKNEWAEHLKFYLARDNVEYVVIHKEEEWVQKKYHLLDSHFNALANKYIVDELSTAIEF